MVSAWSRRSNSIFAFALYPARTTIVSGICAAALISKSSDYREKKRYTPFLTAGLSAGLVNGGDDGSAFALGIPFGAGYKFKMAKRWNSQVTLLFTKTFSDKLDGRVDPEGIATSSLIDNDWMASIQLSVTFDFKERCIECHNQKNQMRK